MPGRAEPEPARNPHDRHWARSRALMWVTLAVWAVFAFGIHLFAPSLDGVTVLGFPVGYYMAAQGSLIAFVVLIFWFAARQDRIDRECGVAEEDGDPAGRR